MLVLFCVDLPFLTPCAILAWGECLPGVLLFYQLSQLQPQIYPLMEKPPK